MRVLTGDIAGMDALVREVVESAAAAITEVNAAANELGDSLRRVPNRKKAAEFFCGLAVRQPEWAQEFGGLEFTGHVTEPESRSATPGAGTNS